MKHNFKNGDRVVICNIGDGKEYNGTICGKVFEHIVDTYIVKPDNSPFNDIYKYDCVALVESCLRPLLVDQRELVEDEQALIKANENKKYDENTISVWKYEDAPKEYKELSK